MPGFFGRVGCPGVAGDDDVGVRRALVVGVVEGLGRRDVAGDARAAVGVVTVRV